MSNPESYWAVPVAEAPVSERTRFLRAVAMLVFASLSITTVSAFATTIGLFMTAAAGISLPWFVQLLLVLGGMYGAQLLGGPMTRSENAVTRIAGFTLGSVLQGFALGFLLIVAAMVSMQAGENPLWMPFQALLLVGLTVTGMVMWLLTGPKNLNMVAGGVAALSLPMLALMGITIFFPVNGIFGILISLVFVGISVAGLLVNLNQVMHQFSTRMPVAAAFHVSVGIVVLFWNVLSLLMRLRR